MQPNIKLNFPLKDLTFFKVGGECDIFFEPYDADDLKNFLQAQTPSKILCLGAMSNVLITDAGFDGCIVSTRNSFNEIKFLGNNRVKVGAGVLLSKFITECIKAGQSCCEQMLCIPGTIGGALIMNAGIPSFEIFDVLTEVHGIDLAGNDVFLSKDNIKYSYRHGNIPKDVIITSCILKTKPATSSNLNEIVRQIRTKRLSSQPIGLKTCGSTFKNPPGLKAWQLIDHAGCRSMRVGGAIVSDLHCNFIINDDNATSDDILKLIAKIKNKVFETHGIMLEEEIKIIGNV